MSLINPSISLGVLSSHGPAGWLGFFFFQKLVLTFWGSGQRYLDTWCPLTWHASGHRCFPFCGCLSFSVLVESESKLSIKIVVLPKHRDILCQSLCPVKWLKVYCKKRHKPFAWIFWYLKTYCISWHFLQSTSRTFTPSAVDFSLAFWRGKASLYFRTQKKWMWKEELFALVVLWTRRVSGDPWIFLRRRCFWSGSSYT